MNEIALQRAIRFCAERCLFLADCATAFSDLRTAFAEWQETTFPSNPALNVKSRGIAHWMSLAKYLKSGGCFSRKDGKGRMRIHGIGLLSPEGIAERLASIPSRPKT